MGMGYLSGYSSRRISYSCPLVDDVFMQQIGYGRDNLVRRNIRRLRIERRMWSMNVICCLQLKGIGISSSTYSKVESGRSNPSVNMILALAEVFRCGCEEFFTEQNFD